MSGVVQGVGFRPYAWRRATRAGLAGWVENDPSGASIEVQGPAAAVAGFVAGLAADAPPLARVDAVRVDEIPPQPAAGFAILESSAHGRPATLVPPDVAPCEACRADVADPANRRHRHPFASCTDCGPRYTIIESLPYDRGSTTMRPFAMCPRCAAEYADPADRRFHAQPIACPDCGPIVWFAPAGGAVAVTRAAARVTGEAAIAASRALLLGGGVLAVKGVGGFQFACDATDEAAVARLRARKRRGGKPFAVLVADVAAARRWARIDDQERRLLEGPERPIVLLRRSLPAGDGLAESVAPDAGFVGAILPASPVHDLLCAGMPPLVLTSGNVAEEPIEHANDSAAGGLAGIADAFLMHDRGIHVACDDSVVRCVAGAVLPIRRARGHVPLPVPLGSTGPCVLAVGGDLKAAICVTRGDRAFVGQHLGDAENLATIDALDRAVDRLVGLLGAEPVAVAADLHPGYHTAAWARRHAAARRIPLLGIQHHEAHVAALVAERHGADLNAAEGFVAACFDGTGYGRDGTIQGGEFLVVEAGAVRHAAGLEPFPLPGGDACVRHPWRTALALLHAAGLDWHEQLQPVAAAGAAERRVLARQLDRGVGCVATTSMGRLFDAVAALAGVRHSIAYEAEAALALETLAATASADVGGYGFDLRAGAPLRIGWRGLVTAVVRDVLDGVPSAVIAARFHAAVAGLVAEVCGRLRPRGGLAGLTGGVFQNALLTEQAIAALGRAGFEVAVHHLVPPNDGGLGLGQAVIARGMLG